MNPLLMLGGSLAAVALMVAVAWALKLGGAAIDGEAEAMREAEAILPGFDAVRAVVASDGRAALVHGRDGGVALLKVHGARVAGRRLAAPVVAEPVEGGLRVASGEALFGTVVLKGVSAL